MLDLNTRTDKITITTDSGKFSWGKTITFKSVKCCIAHFSWQSSKITDEIPFCRDKSQRSIRRERPGRRRNNVEREIMFKSWERLSVFSVSRGGIFSDPFVPLAGRPVRAVFQSPPSSLRYVPGRSFKWPSFAEEVRCIFTRASVVNSRTRLLDKKQYRARAIARASRTRSLVEYKVAPRWLPVTMLVYRRGSHIA